MSQQSLMNENTNGNNVNKISSANSYMHNNVHYMACLLTKCCYIFDARPGKHVLALFLLPKYSYSYQNIDVSQ